MEKIKNVIKRNNKLWMLLVSAIVSAIVSIGVNYANVYYWEVKKRELTALTISKYLKRQVENLESGLAAYNFDMIIGEGDELVKLSYFILPNRDIWSFYDQHIRFDALENLTSLPPKSIVDIASYHRMVTYAKGKNDKLLSDIDYLVEKGINVKGLMNLFPDVDSKEVLSDFQVIKVGEIMYSYLSLRASLLEAIASGFKALATISDEVLNDVESYHKYKERSEYYEHLSKEEKVRASKAAPIAEKKSKEVIRRVFNTLPKDLQEFMKAMSKAYCEPLPIQ